MYTIKHLIEDINTIQNVNVMIFDRITNRKAKMSEEVEKYPLKKTVDTTITVAQYSAVLKAIYPQYAFRVIIDISHPCNRKLKLFRAMK